MKLMFLSALVLLSLVGCDSDSVTKKEDCSINDVKVSCDQFKTGSGDQGKPASFSLEAKAEGDYEYKNGVLKILNKIAKTVERTVGDQSYQCFLEIPKGLEMDIVADEKELILTSNNETVTYSRSKGSLINYYQLELGKFERFDNESNIQSYIKLNPNGKIEFSAVCFYK